MFGIDLERSTELLFRLRSFALPEVEPAQVNQGIRRFRCLGDGLLKRFLGTRHIPARQPGLRQSDRRLQVARGFSKHLFEVRFRALRIPKSKLRQGQQVQRLGIVRKQIQNVLGALLCLLHHFFAAARSHELRQLQLRPGVPGIQFGGLPEV